MKRREFIKTLGLAAAGFTVPYILPTGSLFAKTSSRKVNHVVFCMFAGGVRNMEMIHRQEFGNLTPNILEGVRIDKPGVRTDMPPAVVSQPLQKMGTLFPEMRYKEGPTGHFNGHSVAITGKYTYTGLNLRENPEYPTIFEYYRKHTSPTKNALNAWWVSEILGPYPALNYSRYAGYGASFGANFIAPVPLFFSESTKLFSTPTTFHPEELSASDKFRYILDSGFHSPLLQENGGDIYNSPEDAELLRQFMRDMVQKKDTGELWNIFGGAVGGSGDTYNVYFALEVMKAFQPEILVLNMMNVDVCHDNFTSYLNNMQIADYAVGQLWNGIQNIPGMANDTVLIIMPEHGRDLEPNSHIDEYGRGALDHTGDNTSREVFALIVGPPDVIKQNQIVGTASSPVGECIDIIPTIASLLGFYDAIPSGMLSGRVLEEAFV